MSIKPQNRLKDIQCYINLTSIKKVGEIAFLIMLSVLYKWKYVLLSSVISLQPFQNDFNNRYNIKYKLQKIKKIN